MMFIYKAAKLAPVWTTVLKIREIFVHQTLTEDALLQARLLYFHYTIRLNCKKILLRKISLVEEFNNFIFIVNLSGYSKADNVGQLQS